MIMLEQQKHIVANSTERGRESEHHFFSMCVRVHRPISFQSEMREGREQIIEQYRS